MLYFFGWQTYHVLVESAVSYLLMMWTPRDQCHKYVTAFVFTYLSLQHLNSVLYHFGTYDLVITTNTMLLTTRLQSLACCYADGAKNKTDLSERQ